MGRLPVKTSARSGGAGVLPAACRDNCAMPFKSSGGAPKRGQASGGGRSKSSRAMPSAAGRAPASKRSAGRGGNEKSAVDSDGNENANRPCTTAVLPHPEPHRRAGCQPASCCGSRASFRWQQQTPARRQHVMPQATRGVWKSGKTFARCGVSSANSRKTAGARPRARGDAHTPGAAVWQRECGCLGLRSCIPVGPA